MEATRLQQDNGLVGRLERAMVEVRAAWFDASFEQRPWAVAVKEMQGEILFCVAGRPEDSPRFTAEAVSSGSCMVVTSHTVPDDLADHLQIFGYRPVQGHGVYIYEPDGAKPVELPSPRRTLWQRLSGQEPPPVVVDQVGRDQLDAWNKVCWHAFGRRHTLNFSLQEKKRAMRNMGDRGRWYLASIAGRPVGTAVLYQGLEAAQILAVGTLPGYRGRGVATAIVRRLITDWEQHGRGTLFLDTEVGSGAARLYERHGFVHLYDRAIWAPPYLT